MATDGEESFRFLLYSRALRSMALIFMTLSFSLYLHALGVKIIYIGVVAALTMLFTLVMTLGLGMFGDRKGYRYELIISEFFTMAGAFVIASTSNILLIMSGMIIAGISTGSGGMRGAFSPGSSAYIASVYGDEKERVKRFSRLNIVASLFSVVGSAMFGLVSFISVYTGAFYAYRYLFLIAAFMLLGSLVSLSFLKEPARPKKSTRVMKKGSMKYIAKIIAANIVGGAGVGLAIPLLPLWFNLVFKATNAQISIVFAISYIATALGSYYASRLAGKTGVLNMAAGTRSLNGIFLIALALSPLFPIAGVIYIVRAFISGAGSPNRSTITVKGIGDEDYGTATSLQGIATRASQLSSGASGALMDYALPLPLEIGGALQLISGALYKILLRDKHK
jgi:MFS family permease